MSSIVPVNIVTGTIPANGTLSSELDLSGYSMMGAVFTTTFTGGTLTAQASTKSERDGGLYYRIRESGNANLSLGNGSGTFALTGDHWLWLSHFRYVKLESSVVQTNEVQFTVILKAH